MNENKGLFNGQFIFFILIIFTLLVFLIAAIFLFVNFFKNTSNNVGEVSGASTSNVSTQTLITNSNLIVTVIPQISPVDCNFGI